MDDFALFVSLQNLNPVLKCATELFLLSLVSPPLCLNHTDTLRVNICQFVCDLTEVLRLNACECRRLLS